MRRQQALSGNYYTGSICGARPGVTWSSSTETDDAAVALATRVRISHAHENEAFCELWVDGQMRAYCANAGTALVLAAMQLGIEPATLAEITKGLS